MPLVNLRGGGVKRLPVAPMRSRMPHDALHLSHACFTLFARINLMHGVNF
jgi:hypothetical protein